METNEIKTVPDFLNATANLLEKGWVQKKLATTADGGYISYTSESVAYFCLLGAIERIIYELGYNHYNFDIRNSVIIAIQNKIKESGFIIPTGFGGLASWNDAEDRTQKEVVDLVRECATKITKSLPEISHED